MLCDCPWRVRFKKQLNDSWIVTELIDEHQGHQLEGVDPLSYSVNRPVTAEARATMFELVRDSSTTLNTVASMLNKTYGLSLLPRDAYNRTYDHGQKWLVNRQVPGKAGPRWVSVPGQIGSRKHSRRHVFLQNWRCPKGACVRASERHGCHVQARFRLPLVNIVTVD
ncbi:hypothetical protein V1519DRAFT_440626, partial [Lipomyces tetrasporus]